MAREHSRVVRGDTMYYTRATEGRKAIRSRCKRGKRRTGKYGQCVKSKKSRRRRKRRRRSASRSRKRRRCHSRVRSHRRKVRSGRRRHRVKSHNRRRRCRRFGAGAAGDGSGTMGTGYIGPTSFTEKVKSDYFGSGQPFLNATEWWYPSGPAPKLQGAGSSRYQSPQMLYQN